MAGGKFLWIGAGVLSLLAHAGAAAILTMAPAPKEDLTEEAGGVAAEVAMIGNSAFDAIESGDPDEEIKPEEIEPEVVEAEPEAIQQVQTEEIEPTEELIVPSAEVEIASAPIPEVKPEIVPDDEIKPVPEEEIKPVEKKVEPKPIKKKPVKKAGQRVETKQNAKRGDVDGEEGGSSSASGGTKGKTTAGAGSAAKDKYDAAVRRRLQRAMSSIRGNRGNVVRVSFSLNASGQVSGVRIVGSSGDPGLDAEVLRRAQNASFPAFPDAMNFRSVPYVIPVRIT